MVFCTSLYIYIVHVIDLKIRKVQLFISNCCKRKKNHNMSLKKKKKRREIAFHIFFLYIFSKQKGKIKGQRRKYTKMAFSL